MACKQVTFKEFAERYCKTQLQTPDGLRAVLLQQVQQFHPDGFVLLECQQLDSILVGQCIIYPYGPSNTLKAIPDRPISPRGLASDMSVAIMNVTTADVELEEKG